MDICENIIENYYDKLITDKRIDFYFNDLDNLYDEIIKGKNLIEQIKINNNYYFNSEKDKNKYIFIPRNINAEKISQEDFLKLNEKDIKKGQTIEVTLLDKLGSNKNSIYFSYNKNLKCKNTKSIITYKK